MREPDSTPSFLIVDDHPLFLEALQSALHHSYPHSEIKIAQSLGSAIDELGQHKFSLVLMDLRMPDANGFDGVTRIRATSPDARLAVISAADGPDIVARARTSGANGFIRKSQPRSSILASVSELLNGSVCFPSDVTVDKRPSDPDAEATIDKLSQLTPQQLKVLTRVCEAKLNKQIAFELGVTETTIKAHITLIFKKLGVHSRTQAVLLMQRNKTRLRETEFAVLVAAES